MSFRRRYGFPERKAVIRSVYETTSNEKTPDYAEIVRQLNTCIAAMHPPLTMSELAQMLLTSPMEEIETLLPKLQAMRPGVQ